MDFNLKGKLWAGNIYHQFESICQDVDGLVRQDTVKFVENQVQSVGMTVKRFYSNVVQDILPLSGDIVKPNSQLLDGEQVDKRDQVSVTSTSTNSPCNQGSMHTLGDSDASLPIEFDHTMQVSKRPCADHSPEAESHLHLRKYDADMIQDAKDSGAQEDIRHTLGDSDASLPIEFDHTMKFSKCPRVDHSLEAETHLHLREYDDAMTQDAKESGVQENIRHTLADSDASLPIEFDHIMQFSKPPHAGPSLEAETCLHLREHDGAMIREGKDSGAEENITRDPTPMTAGSSFDNKIISGTSDEDHKKSTMALSSSPAFSAHEEGLPTKKERSAFNHQKGSENFSVDTECLSDISSTVRLFESKLPMIEVPFSNEKGSSSSPSVASAHKVNEDNSLLMDSPLPSACDANGRASEKDSSVHDNYSTKDENFDLPTYVQSPDCVFSHFSCNEKEEMGIMPSTCSTSPKSSSIMESTSADFIQKAENNFHSHSECDDSAYNISTPSSTTAADETKDVNALPACLILEANDNNVLQIDSSEFVAGSSESKHEQHYKDRPSKIVTSPSGTAKTYELGDRVGDLDMETVDLSPDVKHDERSVILNNSNFVRATSHKRNFRYYKKLFQDAFTSQKRLSKEYEHLPILYGDIDMESNQHFEPSSVPAFPNTTVHAVKTQSSQEMCETEWELL